MNKECELHTEDKCKWVIVKRIFKWIIRCIARIFTDKVFIYTLVSIALALIYKLIVDNGFARLPKIIYLDPKKISIENLMFYTWQVQVTIALISITLTSLIIGNLDKTLYGQSVSKVLTITAKWRMNYIEKILFVISLAIINFFCITLRCLPALVIIFFISVGGVIDLIRDSYAILFNLPKYTGRTKNYVYIEMQKSINNVSNKFDDILKNIEQCNRKLILGKEIDISLVNIKFLVDILSLLNKVDNVEKTSIKHKSLRKYLLDNDYVEDTNYIISKIEENKNKSNVVEEYREKIEEVIMNSSKILIDGGYLDDVLDVILQIQNVNIKYIHKQRLLEELINQILDVLEESTSAKDLKKVDKFILEVLLYHYNYPEYQENYDLIKDDILINKICDCFRVIDDNPYIKWSIKKELINGFYKKLIPSQFMTISDYEYNVVKKSVFYICKKLIKENNADLFFLLFNVLYKSNCFLINLSKDSKLYEIIITLSIYIYYITVKDEAYSKERKNEFKRFLNYKNKDLTKDDKGLKEVLICIRDYVWDSFDVIRKEMPIFSWEHMPDGAAKSILMPDAIIEFYLFYTISNINLNYYNEYVGELEIEDCRNILDWYDSDKKLRKYYLESFKKFIDLVMNSTEVEKYNSNMMALFDVINERYVKYKIDLAKQHYNPVLIKTESDELINSLTDMLETKIEGFSTHGECPFKFSIKHKETIIISILSDKKLGYDQLLYNVIMYIVLQNIINISINKEMEYSESNKIKTIFDLIKKYNLSIKRRINSSKNTDFYINHNEDEKDKNAFNGLVSNENIQNLNLGGTPCILLFEDSDVVVNVKVNSIKIRDISIEEIEEDIQRYKVSEDRYKLPSDINVYLTKEQMIQYYLYEDKKIDMDLDVFHNIKAERVVSLLFKNN